MKFVLSCVVFSMLLSACTKSKFLNEVSSSRHEVIKGLDDLQKLLDKEIVMNSTPILPELSADDYYIKDSKLSFLDARDRNAYMWTKEIFGPGENDDDWTLPYEQVLYSNTVLDYLIEKKAADSEKIKYNYLKGDALFKRAYAFYNLAQVFMLPYDATASADPGIPLRLNSDVNEITVRSSAQQTYDRILTDLHDARSLLPSVIEATKRNHSSVPAAMAMLARVYLGMRKYEEALLYSDSCLQLYNTLMDYNDLSVGGFLPFKLLNEETLYQTRFEDRSGVFLGIASGMCIIDSTLYKSYATDDLRRTAFFSLIIDGFPYTKGSYYENFTPFSGLAIDEQYLIRAECLARKGNSTSAMNDLNTLLQKRWKTGSFTPLTAQSAAEALQLILTERRKELVFRGLRWTDIRRLNKEGKNILLKRIINGQEFTLQPNDKRYALPIPPDVINKTGMQQNPR